MLKNTKPLFKSYTVNGVIYTRQTHGRGIAKKIIIVLGIILFLFAYGLAGRADFCGMNPHAKECQNVK